ncbi:hypothetical protein N431DRAFT_493682 [Stipitochalara longipes BDJ]|nr:hypothetical protein N431DRAFT_493682 [Stipitochalara longipes BDJ]
MTENRGPEIISLMIALLVTTWISVILRFYARFMVSKTSGADDWFIVVALCTYSLFGALVLTSRASRVLVTLWSLAEMFFVLFECRPVQFQWDSTIKGGVYTGNLITSKSIRLQYISQITPIFSVSTVFPKEVELQINGNTLIDSNTDGLLWTIVEPGIGITTASIATYRPLIAVWKVPGFERTNTSVRRGTHRNEGLYISFQDLDTAPAITRLQPIETKSNLMAQSGIHNDNGSEELILPHDSIMNIPERAVLYKSGNTT